MKNILKINRNHTLKYARNILSTLIIILLCNKYSSFSQFLYFHDIFVFHNYYK